MSTATLETLNNKELFQFYRAVDALFTPDEQEKVSETAFDINGDQIRPLTHEEMRSYEGYFDIDKFSKSMAEKYTIRCMVSMIYDMQKLRIASGNKLVAAFNIQLGQDPGKSQEQIDKEIKKAVDVLKKEHDLVSDAYSQNKATIKKLIASREVPYTTDEGKQEYYSLQYIRNKNDYDMIEVFENLEMNEKKLVDALQKKLIGIPIYDQFLEGVKGVGPLMSGVIIGYFNIYQAKYVSSFIKYVGIDVLWDDDKQQMVGRTKAKKYMVDKQFINKDKEVETKKSLTYNPFVKSKLIGVLPECFIKAKSDYCTPYYNYLNRKMNDVAYKNYNYPHLVKMANRYMVKQFLKDLFVKWKELEGLPIPASYEEEYLHRAPHHWQPFAEYKAAHPEEFVKKSKDDPAVFTA